MQEGDVRKLVTSMLEDCHGQMTRLMNRADEAHTQLQAASGKTAEAVKNMNEATQAVASKVEEHEKKLGLWIDRQLRNHAPANISGWKLRCHPKGNKQCRRHQDHHRTPSPPSLRPLSLTFRTTVVVAIASPRRGGRPGRHLFLS